MLSVDKVNFNIAVSFLANGERIVVLHVSYTKTFTPAYATVVVITVLMRPQFAPTNSLD